MQYVIMPAHLCVMCCACCVFVRQVLSFATSYALYLLYLVPVLAIVQVVKMGLAAKKMLGGLLGGGCASQCFAARAFESVGRDWASVRRALASVQGAERSTAFTRTHAHAYVRWFAVLLSVRRWPLAARSSLNSCVAAAAGAATATAAAAAAAAAANRACSVRDAFCVWGTGGCVPFARCAR